MNKEQLIERVEGLVTTEAVNRFDTALHTLVFDLIQMEFNAKEIEIYLKNKIDEFNISGAINTVFANDLIP
jgi:hypothetical protein